jgi:hypothetical protein
VQVRASCTEVAREELINAELELVIDSYGFAINRGLPEARLVSSRSTSHEQMWVGHLDGTGALVDVGVVPMITALWVAGVDTSFSCQGSINGWRYLVVRPAHRFIAADVLARLGERVVETHGDDCRWVFQLSHGSFSLLRYGIDWVRTTYPRWDLP